jgi:hypothetical protein
MSKVSKAVKAISKTAEEIGELDLEKDTAEGLILPLLQATQTMAAAILSIGSTLTDVSGGDDDDDDDDDDNSSDEDEDEDEDEDSSDDDDDDDEDEDEDSSDDDDDDDDDDFADDEDEDEDSSDDDDDDDDDDDEDDDDDDDEPAPKKSGKKAAKPSKPAKKPAKPAKAEKPAKKGGKAKFAAMNFAELREHLVSKDKKHAKAIDKAMQGVGGRVKAAKLLELAEKKGWL